MPCKHLHELIEICQRNHLKFSSSDLIRMVCPNCGVEEECPSTLCEQYEASHKDEATAPDSSARQG